MGITEDRNGMDLTEAEVVRRDGNNKENINRKKFSILR